MMEVKTNRVIAVFPLIKPPGKSSYDVVRSLKKILPPKTKMGHFGTLDPFATGLLLVGTNQAMRLNEMVHDYLPKTYLAVGKLGQKTSTGDGTEEVSSQDESPYLTQVISKFDLPFLQKTLPPKFEGSYLQSPHPYSAAKFQGKKLHEWAREGTTINKPPVARTIYKLQIVRYRFPYVLFRATVSSGTYIRTLFEDISKFLGTYGHLVSLMREKIGAISLDDAISSSSQITVEALDHKKINLERLLPFRILQLQENRIKPHQNGLTSGISQTILFKEGELDSSLVWIYGHPNELLGLGEIKDEIIIPKINFLQEF